MTEQFKAYDVTHRYVAATKSDWQDKTLYAVGVSLEEAQKILYDTFMSMTEIKTTLGDPFWKILFFDGNHLEIEETAVYTGGVRGARHSWKVKVAPVRLKDGFWISDMNGVTLEDVVSFLSGSERNQDKVTFVKNNKRYQVKLEEL